ncbi:MAG: tetratricopeptide repeat protein [Ktedonobacterales bacterium]
MSLTEEQQRLWDTGVALSKEGRLDEAQVEFDHLAEMVPDSAPVWLAKAHNLNYLHRYKEAVAAAEHGLALDASSGHGWSIKGNALYGLKRYDEAAFAYITALPLRRDTAVVLPGVAGALLGAGRPAAALTVLDQLVQMTPDDGLVWYYRAKAYNNLGQYREASDAIGKALQLGVGDVEYEYDALIDQAYAYVGLGHDEEALAVYEQAIRLSPKDRLGWEGKLKVLRRMRRWGALWRALKEFMAAKPRL